MNLVAKEFVAARDDEHGVLVLSQFTGAARELTEALIVNPYDLDEASDALAAALRMPPDEQRERMRVDARARRPSSTSIAGPAACSSTPPAAPQGAPHRPAVAAAHAARRRRRIMKHLLSRENRELLAQLAWSNVLLAFDFDGTLAPIVADRRPGGDARPHRAAVRHGLRALPVRGHLRARQGRRRAPPGGAKVRYLIGNHGLEPGTRLGTFARQVAQAHPLLEPALDGVAGIDIEDKRYSLAVHYRRAREKPKARAAIRRAVAGLPVADADHHRQAGGQRRAGSGARARATRCSRCAIGPLPTSRIYVGDDVTDEDVFRLDQPGRLFTVRIGRSRTSAARYYLRQQQEIDALLEHLVALRVDVASRLGRRGGARP